MQFRMQPIHALLISSLAASSSAMTTGSGADTPPTNALSDKPAQEGTTDLTVIRTYFKDGLRFETLDKSFTFKLGAKILFDNNFIHTNGDYEDAFSREEDGAKFRQARVGAEGSVQGVEYKWQYDFAGGTNNKLKDLYLNFPEFCFGQLRVGQFKEPMGLEQLTSFSNATFMERSATDRLVPARNIGFMFHDTCPSKRVNWAAGVFREDGSDTGADTGDGEHAVTARVSGTPMMSDATHLLHLGASGRHYAVRDNPYNLTYTGETTVSLANNLAALSVNADAADSAGLEAAWVDGPLSLQAEYVRTAVDRVDDTWIDMEGHYLFASYFLTGESRAYSPASGTFGRVRVAHPRGKDGGCGAWEVGLRASTLDLNSEAGHTSAGGGDGGRVDSYTAGVNWYLNDYTRVMLNYIRIQPDDNQDGTSAADVLAMRLQIDV
jgi:phosphate-selective porin OprO and OprP